MASKDDITYRPRPFGATSAQLAELYNAQRAGARKKLITPTGAIRTQAAHEADCNARIAEVLERLKTHHMDMGAGVKLVTFENIDAELSKLEGGE